MYSFVRSILFIIKRLPDSEKILWPETGRKKGKWTCMEGALLLHRNWTGPVLLGCESSQMVHTAFLPAGPARVVSHRPIHQIRIKTQKAQAGLSQEALGQVLL